MLILIILVNAILGACWRHGLGGWDGPFKWALDTRFETWLWGPDDKAKWSPRRSIILILGWPLSWPLWVVLPWWQAAIGMVLCDLFWRFGHKLDSPKIWRRYGPFAVTWVVARLAWGDRPERKGDFLNNWMAVGEFCAGAMFYACLALILI